SPMSKCSKCGASWTVAGMIACPICNARVETEVPVVEPSKATVQAEFCADAETAPAVDAKKNGTAVVTSPPEIRNTDPVAPDPPKREAPPRDVPVRISVFPSLEPPPAAKPAPAPEKPAPVDASVVLAGASPVDHRQSLPLSSRPLNAPLILGALSMLTIVLLPLTVANEQDQVLGILRFSFSTFFFPFPPLPSLPLLPPP